MNRFNRLFITTFNKWMNRLRRDKMIDFQMYSGPLYHSLAVIYNIWILCLTWLTEFECVCSETINSILKIWTDSKSAYINNLIYLIKFYAIGAVLFVLNLCQLCTWLSQWLILCKQSSFGQITWLPTLTPEDRDWTSRWPVCLNNGRYVRPAHLYNASDQ